MGYTAGLFFVHSFHPEEAVVHKYLILNDDENLVRSWKRLLENKIPNVFVVLCTTVHKALETIERINPTVVLTDIEFTRNGTEGLQIAGTLRASQSHIKVYIASASAEFFTEELKKLGIGAIKVLDVEEVVQYMATHDVDSPPSRTSL